MSKSSPTLTQDVTRPEQAKPEFASIGKGKTFRQEQSKQTAFEQGKADNVVEKKQDVKVDQARQRQYVEYENLKERLFQGSISTDDKRKIIGIISSNEEVRDDLFLQLEVLNKVKKSKKTTSDIVRFQMTLANHQLINQILEKINENVNESLSAKSAYDVNDVINALDDLARLSKGDLVAMLNVGSQMVDDGAKADQEEKAKEEEKKKVEEQKQEEEKKDIKNASPDEVRAKFEQDIKIAEELVNGAQKNTDASKPSFLSRAWKFVTGSGAAKTTANALRDKKGEKEVTTHDTDEEVLKQRKENLERLKREQTQYEKWLESKQEQVEQLKKEEKDTSELEEEIKRKNACIFQNISIGKVNASYAAANASLDKLDKELGYLEKGLEIALAADMAAAAIVTGGAAAAAVGTAVVSAGGGAVAVTAAATATGTAVGTVAGASVGTLEGAVEGSLNGNLEETLESRAKQGAIEGAVNGAFAGVGKAYSVVKVAKAAKAANVASKTFTVSAEEAIGKNAAEYTFKQTSKTISVKARPKIGEYIGRITLNGEKIFAKVVEEGKRVILEYEKKSCKPALRAIKNGLIKEKKVAIETIEGTAEKMVKQRGFFKWNRYIRLKDIPEDSILHQVKDKFFVEVVGKDGVRGFARVLTSKHRPFFIPPIILPPSEFEKKEKNDSKDEKEKQKKDEEFTAKREEQKRGQELDSKKPKNREEEAKKEKEDTERQKQKQEKLGAEGESRKVEDGGNLTNGLTENNPIGSDAPVDTRLGISTDISLSVPADTKPSYDLAGGGDEEVGIGNRTNNSLNSGRASGGEGGNGSDGGSPVITIVNDFTKPGGDDAPGTVVDPREQGPASVESQAETLRKTLERTRHYEISGKIGGENYSNRSLMAVEDTILRNVNLVGATVLSTEGGAIKSFKRCDLRDSDISQSGLQDRLAELAKRFEEGHSVEFAVYRILSNAIFNDNTNFHQDAEINAQIHKMLKKYSAPVEDKDFKIGKLNEVEEMPIKATLLDKEDIPEEVLEKFKEKLDMPDIDGEIFLIVDKNGQKYYVSNDYQNEHSLLHVKEKVKNRRFIFEDIESENIDSFISAYYKVKSKRQNLSSITKKEKVLTQSLAFVARQNEDLMLINEEKTLSEKVDIKEIESFNCDYEKIEVETEAIKKREREQERKFNIDQKMLLRIAEEERRFLTFLQELKKENTILSLSISKEVLKIDKIDNISPILKERIERYRTIKKKKDFERLRRIRINEARKLFILFILQILMSQNMDDFDKNKDAFLKYLGSLSPEIKAKIDLKDVFKKLMKSLSKEKAQELLESYYMENCQKLLLQEDLLPELEKDEEKTRE